MSGLKADTKWNANIDVNLFVANTQRKILSIKKLGNGEYRDVEGFSIHINDKS